MERKIVNKLLSWKNDKNKMPLIVYGARQVGKTHSILSFGKEHYRNTVYLNLEDNSEISKIFERDLKPERIIRELSALSGQTILKGDTLIFLDEIQACERALTSLKYFCENAPEYNIISAGSLFGVSINRKKYSFTVGKVQMMTLYPLDFEEFLWALDKKELANMIKESFDTNQNLSLHNTAMDLYKTYMVVGGMPRAILEYIGKEDFNFVLSAQRNINDAYIADMAKYAEPMETTKIMAAFNSIPAQLAKENKKFQYKVIKTGARSYEYETPLDWLKASGVIIKLNKVNEGKMPLMAYVDNSSFKVYLMDTGLLCSKFGIPAAIIQSNTQSFNEFKGALAENYVCGALIINGYTPYYWESKGKAELDFVIQDNQGNIIAIEVKSSENVRAKSLALFVKQYNISYSIHISAKNFGYENNIKSVPLYAVFCI